MDFSAGILGSRTAQTLQHRISDVILRIGRNRFSRRDLAKVDCFNFTAAQNLSHILNKELKVTDVKDVFFNVHPVELALPRLGSFSFAVLGAAFEAVGVGGNDPLENWLKHHRLKAATFDTIKARDAREQAAAKHKRRNNVTRFRKAS